MASCGLLPEADLLNFAYVATPLLSCTYSRAA